MLYDQVVHLDTAMKFHPSQPVEHILLASYNKGRGLHV